MRKQGMPASSVAEAQAWRVARKGVPARAGGDGVDDLPPVAPVARSEAAGMLGELEGRIAKARRLADAAHARAQSEVDAGDGEAAKKAGDLAGSTTKTLLLLERELRQRRIDAGELVPMAAAVERFGKILAELMAAVDSGEAAFARDANPDNPGRAVVAFRKFRDGFRKKVAAANVSL